MAAEYADYGRRVVIRNQYGERLTGVVERTLTNAFGGGPVYEVAIDGMPDYTRPGHNAVRRLGSHDRLTFADSETGEEG